MDHIFAVVDKAAPAAYWENWWTTVVETPRLRVLRSGRRGKAARTDADVLHGRLASGLHFFLGYSVDVKDAIDMAVFHDHDLVHGEA